MDEIGNTIRIELNNIAGFKEIIADISIAKNNVVDRNMGYTIDLIQRNNTYLFKYNGINIVPCTALAIITTAVASEYNKYQGIQRFISTLTSSLSRMIGGYSKKHGIHDRVSMCVHVEVTLVEQTRA